MILPYFGEFLANFVPFGYCQTQAVADKVAIHQLLWSVGMSSDNDFSKTFWINQATHENARASHQRLLNNHLLNEQMNQKSDPRYLLEIERLKDINNGLKEDNIYYKELLAKPMAEIAQANRSFKETYEVQMELLADWMVSQKAFKELAIQFGIEKGLTLDEVHQMGLNKELDVLENKNDPSHKTNADTIKGIEQHIDSLKRKFHSRKR